jgi:diguanylate cyclase (GGDEF)-like protein
MQIDKKSWLRRAEIFAALDDRELELIEGYSGLVSHSGGDTIISEGDRGGVLYIIVSGRVQAVKTDKWEGDTLIAELVEGDILGELEFFTGALFNNSVKAVSDVTLMRLPDSDEDFRDILERHPDISAVMLYRFLKVFSNRLRKANVLVKDNSALVQELKRQVYGDKLTGLYNKTYLEETLPGILKKRNGPVGLLLMKPDNFKMINDTFGHEAGDDTLKIMAAALNRFMEGRGTVLRYMGNELGVILEGHGRQEVYSVAQEILSMFNELDISEATGSKEVFLSMSIGAAVYPDHANIPDELILKTHDLPLVGRERGGNIILFPEDAAK